MNFNYSTKIKNSVVSILSKSITAYKYEQISVSNSILSEYAEDKVINCKRITNSAWIDGILHQLGMAGMSTLRGETYSLAMLENFKFLQKLFVVENNIARFTKDKVCIEDDEYICVLSFIKTNSTQSDYQIKIPKNCSKYRFYPNCKSAKEITDEGLISKLEQLIEKGEYIEIPVGRGVRRYIKVGNLDYYAKKSVSGIQYSSELYDVEPFKFEIEVYQKPGKEEIQEDNSTLEKADNSSSEAIDMSDLKPWRDYVDSLRITLRCQNNRKDIFEQIIKSKWENDKDQTFIFQFGEYSDCEEPEFIYAKILNVDLKYRCIEYQDINDIDYPNNSSEVRLDDLNMAFEIPLGSSEGGAEPIICFREDAKR